MKRNTIFMNWKTPFSQPNAGSVSSHGRVAPIRPAFSQVTLNSGQNKTKKYNYLKALDNNQNQAKIREKSTSGRQDLVVGEFPTCLQLLFGSKAPAVAGSGAHNYPPTQQPRNQRTELHSSWKVRGRYLKGESKRRALNFTYKSCPNL